MLLARGKSTDSLDFVDGRTRVVIARQGRVGGRGRGEGAKEGRVARQGTVGGRGMGKGAKEGGARVKRGSGYLDHSVVGRLEVRVCTSQEGKFIPVRI